MKRRKAVSRLEIEGLIETLIALLDEIDGDPDLEFQGDEIDHDDAEDEIGRRMPCR